MTIFGNNIISQHLVNSQNILRPILRQNLNYDHLQDVLGQCYDIYYDNYDAFDMFYDISSS